MAETTERLTYEIIIDTSNGLVKINGLTKGFVQASTAAKRLEEAAGSVEKNLGQTASKAGLAGAAVTELGRTISDSNYGMMAMANNMQQLSTLFITLVSTSGGFKNAVGLMKEAFVGPLGLIVVFQVVIAIMEKFAIAQRNAASETKNLTDELNKQRAQLSELYYSLFTGFDDLSVDKDSIMAIMLKMFPEFRNAYDKLTDAEKENGKVVKDLINDYGRLLQVRTEIDRIEKGEGPAFKDRDARMRVLLTLRQEELELAEKFVKVKEEFEGVRGPNQEKALNPWDQMMTDILGYPVDQDTLMEALSLIYGDPGNESIKAMQDRAKEALAAMSKQYVDYGDTTTKVSKDVVGIMGLVGDSMVSLGQVIGEQSEIGKAVAVAGGLIDTSAAVLKALKQEGLPPGFRIPYAISVGAFGLAQVARMARVNPRGSRAGGGSAGTPPSAPAITPSFNVVGGSRVDQLNDTIRQELGRPQRAYVVNKDVRSAEELERNIVSGASI